jgi:hypothetical protein
MLRLRLGGEQGFHLKLSNRPDIVARLARGDVNMPNYDGFPIHVQVLEVKFEAAVYELLRSEPNILASRLLYHRIPVQHVGPRLDLPQDIAGRRLFLFERAEGENNVWRELSPEQKVRAYVSNLFCSIQFNYANLLSRPVFLLSQPVSVHHCSTSISRSTSRLFGSANASLNKSPNRSPFPLLLHANFALLFSRPRSKRQSGT